MLPSWINEDDAYYYEKVRMVDHEAIGSAVRDRREALCVSLRSMAKWMNISAPYLSDLERGMRSWPQDRLNDASDVLDMFERAKLNTDTPK